MSHVEVKILIPEKRLAEFYKAYAEWLEPTQEATSSRAGRRSRASSYAALGEHLQDRSGDRVSMDFGQIEGILARSLPASAYRHRAWWANTESHSQAAEWLQRGWRASDLDLDNQRVTFLRAG
jgi:hypothetical protein